MAGNSTSIIKEFKSSEWQAASTQRKVTFSACLLLTVSSTANSFLTLVLAKSVDYRQRLELALKLLFIYSITINEPYHTRQMLILTDQTKIFWGIDLRNRLRESQCPDLRRQELFNPRLRTPMLKGANLLYPRTLLTLYKYISLYKQPFAYCLDL